MTIKLAGMSSNTHFIRWNKNNKRANYIDGPVSLTHTHTFTRRPQGKARKQKTHTQRKTKQVSDIILNRE